MSSPDVADLTVRAMLPTDVPFVFTLSARVFAAYSSDPDATLRSMLDRKRSLATVATRGDVHAGFLVLSLFPLGRPFGPWTNPVRTHVDAIAVRPDLHGLGVGRALLEHAMSCARTEGGVSMSLTTAETNARAQRLFRSAGLWPLWTEKNVYRGGQPGVVMFRGL